MTSVDLDVPRAWDVAWAGTPSWEIGRPQAAVRALLGGGAFGAPAGHRRVLDVGSGAGRHAVLLAEAGYAVTAVDVAPVAIDRTIALARETGVHSRISAMIGDALSLDPATTPGAPFDTILDVGLFHVLQPDDRARYASVLAGLARPGARAFIVTWSDRNPFGFGPARVRRRELRDAFGAAIGWRVDGIDAAELETRLEPGRVHAWLARLRRR